MQREALINKRTGDSCLLCGEPPEIIGFFTPEDPGAWGGPNGETRLFRYCLCGRCHERPDTPEDVEKIIRVELNGRGETHAE